VTDDRITHHIVVDASPVTAFEAVTAHLGAWWPLAYTFSGPAFAGAAVEPNVGGMWFETSSAGERLPWGMVRVFDPPGRLVVAFAIGADRQPVADADASEVDMTFTAEGQRQTRVQLVHTNFSRHGAGADAVRAGMDSPQGWPLILAELRRWLDGRTPFRFIVTNVDEAISFYSEQLDFSVDVRPAPGFVSLSRGALRLLLNQPGAGGAGASTPSGGRPEPGGWSRPQLVVKDLDALVGRLRAKGCRFRSDVIEGNGGKQILLEDPSGNPIELFEPYRR
jgi:uncharacterized protein YndB with AHSA1/START domain/catechol 2,3-dioxygenase-like lactoylglutathione lyase family enzyme